MHKRSSLSLYKSILRYPFHPSTKPTSPFLIKPTYKKPCLPSNLPHLSYPTSSIFHLRSYSGGSGGEFDKNKVVDEINFKFAEAREEIEAAMESKETVYFNEEAECARDAVNEVLGLFDGLLGKLEGQEREALQRSMGLKIEQLKAELQQLDD